MVTPRLVLGVLLSLIGILLALDNIDILNARPYLRYWPVVLIVMGAIVIGRARDSGGSFGGIVLAAAGTWLLLNTLDIVDVRLWDVFWPLVLILVGANLVRQTLQRGRAPAPASDTVSLMAVLSGVQRASNAKAFKGGELFAFMGGCDLDLRQASLAPGEEATIDCFAMMGGLDIKVPQAWAVDTRVLPLMGGVEDNTSVPPGESALPGPRLVLRGMVIMGGIEVKN